jgi:NADPH:quinone reductase-like Zn-dependent oxidoreductase
MSLKSWRSSSRSPGPGEVVVRVKATSINPGEAKIREGLLHARWPATFPSGEGSDLAGTIEAVGDGVTGFAAGDDVLGFTDDRSSHADSVRVPVNQLVRRPPGFPGRWRDHCTSRERQRTPRSEPSILGQGR